jgi:hypothetical protein
MRLPSGSGVFGAVGLSAAEDGVDEVDAAAGERDHGLAVALSFVPLAGVEGAAGGVVERAEGGLVEDPFQRLLPPLARRR